VPPPHSILKSHKYLSLSLSKFGYPFPALFSSSRRPFSDGSNQNCMRKIPNMAAKLHGGIQSNSMDVKSDSLKKLASLSRDVAFAQEFISRNGLSQLFHIVEEDDNIGEILAYALKAFVELMEHDFVSWETLSPAFIKKIVSYVNIIPMDASIQQISLAILENMVPTSRPLFELVKQQVTLERLIALLQVMNRQLQLKAMALLIALLLNASESERRVRCIRECGEEEVEPSAGLLASSNVACPTEGLAEHLWWQQKCWHNIVHASEPIGDEMAHYLYVLQSLTLNLLERRMRSPMDPYSQEQRELLQSLRHAAFVSENESSTGSSNTERRHSLCAKEFRKLGFVNNSNPAMDLHRVPPGLLALDSMVYFSRHFPSAYSRFILENSSREDKHECPFARSSIQLSFMLCEILHVGEPCSETAQAFYPMFFGQEHFFEELFCVCIQLLNKTWKEMRATQEDFDKVMQVVREQITRTLNLKPTSLELFKSRVNALNYSEILRLRQTERMHQEEILAAPVLELRERLKPELLKLIQQQRLLHLCEGTLFRKISSRRRQDKLWYCRLSPNHKFLHYGDVDEGIENPPIESLQEKVPVADMKALLVGRECPHTKEKSSGKQNKDLLDLAFSISCDVGEYLNFIAPTWYEFCLWTDGLNVLLGREMVSERTQSDLDILLSMELKLRLLDLENIPIPDTPPVIPKPPSNLNFCYDFTHIEQ
uniref:Engulfment and cell motility 3 n=1 Tax=Varanus komodoensis TaxID=61221 RepID=A0A8D2IWH8_VARKO